MHHLAETPHAYVILTARADFYPDLMVAPLWPEIKAHRMEVVPLDEGGLRQAIVRPAEAVGVFIEETLVERLVADAAGEPGVLPLVQETLVLLWERLERRFLPLRAYEALASPPGPPGPSGGERTGLQVAMARRAEAALAALSTPEQQAIARRIFLRLVQFGEGRADTRRQQPIAELQSATDDPLLFERTLHHLADRRLLTLGGEERSGGREVDIAHEALITGWPRFQRWLDEGRKAEQALRRLEDKAKEWVHLGQGSGGLLDEVALREAADWLDRPDVRGLGCSQALQDLVRDSRATIERRIEQEEGGSRAGAGEHGEKERAPKRNRRRRRSLLLNALAVAFATQASQFVQGRLEQNDLAALLARQAYLFNQHSGGYALDQVDRAMRLALGLPHFAGALHSDRGAGAVAFSSDGRWLASGGSGGIDIWDLGQLNAVLAMLRGPRKLTPRTTLRGDGNGTVAWLSFRPQRHALVSVNSDGSVCFWDLRQPDAPLAILDERALMIEGNIYGKKPITRGLSEHISIECRNSLYTISPEVSPCRTRRIPPDPTRHHPRRDLPSLRCRANYRVPVTLRTLSLRAAPPPCSSVPALILSFQLFAALSVFRDAAAARRSFRHRAPFLVRAYVSQPLALRVAYLVLPVRCRRGRASAVTRWPLRFAVLARELLRPSVSVVVVAPSRCLVLGAVGRASSPLRALGGCRQVTRARAVPAVATSRRCRISLPSNRRVQRSSRRAQGRSAAAPMRGRPAQRQRPLGARSDQAEVGELFAHRYLFVQRG